jgi:hypothetical protein
MDIRQKGKWFGPGRAFGFHNPLGNDLQKARDPFINYATLAGLSHSGNDQVRQAVAENLLGRLERGIDRQVAQFFLREFDQRTVSSGLIEKLYQRFPDSEMVRAVCDHPKTDRKLLLQIVATSGADEIALVAYQKIFETLSISEIDYLALRKLHPQIAYGIALNHNASQYALMNLLVMPGYSRDLYEVAFSKFSPIMTREEARFVALARSTPPQVIRKVLKYPQLPADLAAEIISGLTRKSAEFYKFEIDQAVMRMRMCAQPFLEILGHLDKMNSELADGVYSFLESSPK